MAKLEGKVAVVTGASREIGAAVARALDEQGGGSTWRRGAAPTSASKAPSPGRATSATVYCASKFAQVGFTRALDHELREHDVRCTNVCPGGVATDFAIGRGRTPDMPELRGMMTADDVAETVLFVLTRPRNHRILETVLRPMIEPSWG